MGVREDTADYRQLFLRNVPLMDTRAPVEFTRGSLPNAVNLPLLDDAERHQVGIRYREAGQGAAIALGEQLVCGEVKQARLAAWCDFAGRHPEGYLYCFRGGLRSQTCQAWMREAGVDYPLVTGGYKAMRRFLIESLEESLASCRLVLVSGRTGTGKTRAIEALQRAIDLEGLARHRGSSFGALLEPQPGQVDFENAISAGLLRLVAADAGPVMLEDEGRLIGRLSLPEPLRQAMQGAPMLVVEESIDSRVDVVLEDYIGDLGRRFTERFGAAGSSEHEAWLLENLSRIRRRLGGERHQRIAADMAAAFEAQRHSGEPGGHRRWIEELLVEYYDPMYDYQLSRREGEVLARGDRDRIIAVAQAMAGQAA
jgi:tRNA 2-selenouridine synthase